MIELNREGVDLNKFVSELKTHYLEKNKGNTKFNETGLLVWCLRITYEAVGRKPITFQSKLWNIKNVKKNVKKDFIIRKIYLQSI
jgi:hypothetical protein